MGSKVNVKMWIYASVAVFIAMSLLEFLVSRLILTSMYLDVNAASPQPDDPMKFRILVYIGRAFYSAAFAFIFTKGFEGRPGVGEGVRYGLWIGVLIFVPTLFVNLVITSFPAGSTITRCLASLIEGVICGIIVNLIYRKEVKAATP